MTPSIGWSQISRDSLTLALVRRQCRSQLGQVTPHSQPRKLSKSAKAYTFRPRSCLTTSKILSTSTSNSEMNTLPTSAQRRNRMRSVRSKLTTRRQVRGQATRGPAWSTALKGSQSNRLSRKHSRIWNSSTPTESRVRPGYSTTSSTMCSHLVYRAVKSSIVMKTKMEIKTQMKRTQSQRPSTSI